MWTKNQKSIVLPYAYCKVLTIGGGRREETFSQFFKSCGWRLYFFCSGNSSNTISSWNNFCTSAWWIFIQKWRALATFSDFWTITWVMDAFHSFYEAVIKECLSSKLNHFWIFKKKPIHKLSQNLWKRNKFAVPEWMGFWMLVDESINESSFIFLWRQNNFSFCQKMSSLTLSSSSSIFVAVFYSASKTN